MGKISESHRPGGHITSLALPPGNLYNTPLSPPAGIFKTHHCHLLQVDLQHITVTSCRYLYNTSLSPPAGIFTSHRCHLLQVDLQHITVTSCRYLYNTSLSPPPGRFTAHHCHLLQVSFRHITVTSCRYLYNTSLPPSPAPGAVKKPPCTGGGSIINGATSSSFLLLPFSSYSWFCSSSWTLDTGHWTLDTPPPPQDLDPWRLPVPAPRVQTAAYRETNITGEYLGLQIRLVLSYFYFSKNGPKNI